MRVSTATFGSSGVVPNGNRAVTDLTEQAYGRRGQRGVINKMREIYSQFRYNPRGTLFRSFKPAGKLVICTYFGIKYFEICYKMRLDPPWEKYYRELANN